MRRYYYLAIILAGVAVLGIGAALVLSLQHGEHLEYKGEWIRALLQVGLIAVLGAVTSGVLEVVKDAILQRRDESQLRFEALNELGSLYMDVKLIRREAQAAQSLSPKQINELNEQQVLLELLEANSSLFPEVPCLKEHLNSMEKYLNRVANKPDSPERKDFLEDGFHSFSAAFKMSASLMRSAITKQGIVPKGK
jgi:hypothetical protein